MKKKLILFLITPVFLKRYTYITSVLAMNILMLATGAADEDCYGFDMIATTFFLALLPVLLHSVFLSIFETWIVKTLVKLLKFEHKICWMGSESNSTAMTNHRIYEVWIEGRRYETKVQFIGMFGTPDNPQTEVEKFTLFTYLKN